MSAFAGKNRSKAAPADPTLVPSGIDASTFFVVIPEEIKLASPLFHSYEADVLKSVVDNVFQELASLKTSNDEFTVSPELYEKENNDGDINLLIAAVFLIVRCIIRTKSKVSVVEKDLASMNVPAKLISEISNNLKSLRPALESSAISTRVGFPKLHRLRWRVDVTISSGSLSRIMRPNIMMQVRYILSISRMLFYSQQQYSFPHNI